MKSLPYSLLLLPFAKVVFFVRQNMADIAPFPVEMDDYDEAVLVASDIEHHKLANLIRTAEKLSHIREIRPASTFNGFEPVS
jgi:hypothetical protein